MSGRTAKFVAAICDWVLVRTAIGNSPAVLKFVGSIETSSCREFCTVEDCGMPLKSALVAEVKKPPSKATLSVPPPSTTLSGVEAISVGGTRDTGTSIACDTSVPEGPYCVTSINKVPVPDDVSALARSAAVSRARSTLVEMKLVSTGVEFARTELLDLKLLP